jgi:hypothetical protein
MSGAHHGGKMLERSEKSNKERGFWNESVL